MIFWALAFPHNFTAFRQLGSVSIHCLRLKDLSFGELSNLFKSSQNAVLSDEADSGSTYLQRNPAFFFRDPEALCMQIRLEKFTSMVHGMGYLIALLALLPGDFTNTAHGKPRLKLEN